MIELMIKKELVLRNPEKNIHNNEYAGYKNKLEELHPYVLSVMERRYSASEIKYILEPDSFKLHDPFLFNDMKRCVDIIQKNISENKIICINGDYDCDGILGSSIIYRTLRKYTGRVMVYIPTRESDGYGVNKKAIDSLVSHGGGLLISVDCGISDYALIEYAKTSGIDVIVTDHHNCPEKLPDADAILNPKRDGECYPEKNLCGAGIAFKLACALSGYDKVQNHIDYAAVATIADMVPLMDENRAIVNIGLKKLRENPNIALKVLLEKSLHRKDTVNSERISFSVAPRINAAGRMGRVDIAKQLFLGEKVKSISDITLSVDLLCGLNDSRKMQQHEILKEARLMVADKNCIIVSGKKWNPGLIGLVASSLTQIYNRPAFVFCEADDFFVGSARSIESINIYDVIKNFSHLVYEFGGHALAAGLKVKKENFENFRSSVETYFDTCYGEDFFVKKIYYDVKAEISDINYKLYSDLQLLEPCGIGNPSVVFLFKDCIIGEKFSFCENKHVKCDVYQNGSKITAVCFNRSADDLPKVCNIVARISWNGYLKTMELYVEEIM